MDGQFGFGNNFAQGFPSSFGQQAPASFGAQFPGFQQQSFGLNSFPQQQPQLQLNSGFQGFPSQTMPNFPSSFHF